MTRTKVLIYGAPDRREISLRWLSGTFLTGITSSLLMGVALFAALDGRQQLAIPAEAAASMPTDHADDTASRGKRLLGSNIVAMPTDRKIMEVSTIIHEGNKEVVRRKPFAHVKMNLAANHVAAEDYPPFDPLSIFSSSEAPPPPAARAGVIYGSNVESEVSLQTAPFPAKGNTFAFAQAMTLEEVEENVRSNGSVLTDGNTQLSALYYVDPQRFSSKDNDDLDITAGLAARVVEENISVSTPELVTKKTREFADDIIPVRKPETVAQAMMEVGYPEPKAREISGYLQSRLGQADLATGDVLRIGVIQEGDMVLVVRASVYRRGKHHVTVSVDDHGKFIDGQEPPMLDAVASAFSDQPPQIMAGRELPDVYDGIYRAALSYGMSKEMTRASGQTARQQCRSPGAAEADRQDRSVFLGCRQEGSGDQGFRASLRQRPFRRFHQSLLPFPEPGRQFGRLFRRGRQEHPSVPAAQSASERSHDLRFRHAFASVARLFAHAHRHGLGGTARHADHRDG